MFNFITETSVIQAGGTVLGLFALGVLLYALKNFNKVLSNHLHDSHLDKQEDVRSREKLSEVLGKLCEKIDNQNK